jgi:hypothetical protein
MKRTVAISLVVLVCAATSTSAIDLSIEAEAFRYAHDIANDRIAANGTLLFGLDSPGEWTQYELSTSSFGTFGVVMRCWGDINVPYHLQLLVLPSEGEGDPQMVDFNFIGKGSCGS